MNDLSALGRDVGTRPPDQPIRDRPLSVAATQLIQIIMNERRRRRYFFRPPPLKNQKLGRSKIRPSPCSPFGTPDGVSETSIVTGMPGVVTLSFAWPIL